MEHTAGLRPRPSSPLSLLLSAPFPGLESLLEGALSLVPARLPGCGEDRGVQDPERALPAAHMQSRRSAGSSPAPGGLEHRLKYRPSTPRSLDTLSPTPGQSQPPIPRGSLRSSPCLPPPTAGSSSLAETHKAAGTASHMLGGTMNVSDSAGDTRNVDDGGWQPEAVLVPTLFALIFLVGTVGNALVLAVLLRGGQAISTTNLFILNLSVADLCFIVCCVPFQATIYTLDDWVFGSLLCKAVHFLIFLTMHASSFTLAAVSLDRYLAIRYPLHSRELRTPRNALAAIGFIWGLSLLFSGPYLSYYGQLQLANLTVCHPVWSASRRRAMDLCTFIFSYLLPLLVLGLTYARTLCYLWHTVDPVSAGSGARRAKRQVTRMIVIVATLFCLCWMPHHALILWVWFGRFPLTRATYALRILSHLVSYANSCVNPIVYALVSKHFRKDFRKICAGLLRRAPGRILSRVYFAAPGAYSLSVLERESTDLTHLSEAAAPLAPAPAPPSSLASSPGPYLDS
ncbi:PREDICTED: galanin receptor type 2 [Chrysochloris asiatica]|uniref:Galanin receptor type 2 n=1 Tax=Chrysochloris asiatica TaxID=185453 RepID=A0A9B0WWL8_CHRAS|nr:PREDICTED: galanin receptor type 2 [Chrysochloris asiatica]